MLRRVAIGSGLGSSVLTGGGRGRGSLFDQPTSLYPLQERMNSKAFVSVTLSEHISLHPPSTHESQAGPPLCGGGVGVRVS